LKKKNKIISIVLFYSLFQLESKTQLKVIEELFILFKQNYIFIEKNKALLLIGKKLKLLISLFNINNKKNAYLLQKYLYYLIVYNISEI